MMLKIMYSQNRGESSPLNLFLFQTIRLGMILILLLLGSSCNNSENYGSMIHFDGSCEASVPIKNYSKTTIIFDSYSQTMRISLSKEFNEKFGRSFLVYEGGSFYLYGLSDQEIMDKRVKGFGFFKSDLNKSIDSKFLEKLLLKNYQFTLATQSKNGWLYAKYNLSGNNTEDLIIEEKKNAWLVSVF